MAVAVWSTRRRRRGGARTVAGEESMAACGEGRREGAVVRLAAGRSTRRRRHLARGRATREDRIRLAGVFRSFREFQVPISTYEHLPTS